MRAQVRVRTAASAALVIASGELDLATVGRLRKSLSRAVEAGGPIIVDFTDASYIDSSGLGALVSLSRRLRDAGGDLRLVGLSDELRTLFELTRLDALFPLFATRADAMAAR